MTRGSTSRGNKCRPGSRCIVKAAGQQWGEGGGPQPSNPYLVARLAIWESRIADGDVPTGSQLADLLSDVGPGALPRWLFEHVCSHLRGEVRRKPGPKRGSLLEEWAIERAVQRYGELLAWLQKRQKSHRLKGWSRACEAKWSQNPPHEIAKRIIQRRFVKLRRIGIARLANIISSRKSLP